MAPLEPWEKVLVSQGFPDTVHGKAGCTTCHAGQQSPDKESAHTDMIAYPSADVEACGQCHPQVAETFPTSLHASQEGYWTVLEERGADRNHPEMQEMFGNHCASCHTTCGDCHVSQPRSVGGGLIDGHEFNASPSMTRNCTACHGSRVGNEYLGKNEGLMADVHFRQARMKCTDCHTGEAMHGAAEDGGTAHRYEGAQVPTCTSCHPQVGQAGDAIQMHSVHGDTLSCQVCHSITYTSCDGCHVQVSEETGNPFFATEGTYHTFYIGLNPRQDENRPYQYVPVRHVPVAPTSFQFYGENLLSNFDALPTWVYATPHNIQRNTPQTESCDACHDNPELFLTADKVNPQELAANKAVIIDGQASAEASPSQSGFPPMPANHVGLPVCVACHTVIADPVYPESHTSYTDEQCTTCHRLP